LLQLNAAQMLRRATAPQAQYDDSLQRWSFGSSYRPLASIEAQFAIKCYRLNNTGRYAIDYTVIRADRDGHAGLFTCKMRRIGALTPLIFAC